jgi:phosphatidylglycerophosphate synthase
VWGEFFDKETDAFFLLMICLVAFQKAVITGEIMAIGLLRYVFIISLFVLKRGPKKEERSFRAQSIFTIMMLVLLSLFLPLDFPRFPFVALGFVLVFFSFGEDFRKIASGS